MLKLYDAVFLLLCSSSKDLAYEPLNQKVKTSPRPLSLHPAEVPSSSMMYSMIQHSDLSEGRNRSKGEFVEIKRFFSSTDIY